MSEGVCSTSDRLLADRLPGFKLGQAVRFHASEVEAWLEAQRRGPAVTVESPA